MAFCMKDGNIFDQYIRMRIKIHHTWTECKHQQNATGTEWHTECATIYASIDANFKANLNANAYKCKCEHNLSHSQDTH